MDSSVEAYAPTTLLGKVKGLCGTFSKNQQDDFLTPEGDVEKSSQVFAERWKVDEKCIDYDGEVQQEKASDRYPERRQIAATICNTLKDDFQGIWLFLIKLGKVIFINSHNLN